MAAPHHVQAPRQRRGAGPADPSSRLGSRLHWNGSRRQIYIAAVAVAIVIVVALIAVSLLSGKSGKSAAKPIVGKAATSRLLAGIPQHGTTLGNSAAPYKLVEYADFQCPYCGEWARNVFPAVVAKYVRAGTVQIEYRGLDFVGADSKIALQTALAAAGQNRFWNVADLLFRNQGTENTGWVTEPLLRGVVAAVPGLDVSSTLADRNGKAVAARAGAAARLAALDGVNQTPTFEFGSSVEPLQPLTFAALDASAFTAAIDAAMKG